MERDWVVYVLKCRGGELYTGCTVDLERRVAQHNQGTGSKYTRSRRPVSLVYSEPCGSRSRALKRELEIKQMSRREKVRLVQTASATSE